MARDRVKVTTSSVRRAGWTIARRSGLPALGRRLGRAKLLVVCYHGVVEARRSSDWLMLPVEQFERQVAHLARHYRIVPLDEGLRQVMRGDIDRPTACLTFDDGYANNLTVAAPVLRRHEAPATVFLVTDLVGTDRLLWTTRLEYAIRDASIDEIDIGDERADGPIGATPAERRVAARRLKERLKRLPDGQRSRLIEAIVARTGGARRPLRTHRMLSREELATLDADGLVTFGAHTRTHPVLARLTDERLEAEIAGSVEAVRGLKHVSRSFAYPNGRPVDYDARVIRVLRRLGISWGLATTPGLFSERGPAFHVPRLVVGGDLDLDAFVVKASGFMRSSGT